TPRPDSRGVTRPGDAGGPTTPPTRPPRRHQRKRHSVRGESARCAVDCGEKWGTVAASGADGSPMAGLLTGGEVRADVPRHAHPQTRRQGAAHAAGEVPGR